MNNGHGVKFCQENCLQMGLIYYSDPSVFMLKNFFMKKRLKNYDDLNSGHLQIVRYSVPEEMFKFETSS